MKKILKIFIWTIIVVILLFGIMVSSAIVFKQQIIEKIIVELNKYITEPIKTEGIDFSLIKNFPQASLELKNVEVYSSKNINETDFPNKDSLLLLKSEKIYLSVDVIKLLQKQIELKQIDFENAKVNVLIDSKGNNNYSGIITLPKNTNSQNADFSIKIENFVFKNIAVSFYNKYKSMQLKFFLPKYKLSGNFYNDAYKLNAAGVIDIKQLKKQNINFSSQGRSRLNLDMFFHNDSLLVNNGKFSSKAFDIEIKGLLAFGEETNMNLNYKGKNIDINELLKVYVPKKKSEFTAGGKLNLLGEIKGTMSAKKSPFITSSFDIKQGGFSYKSIVLKGFYTKGKFDNGAKHNLSTGKIDLSTIEFLCENSSLKGNLIVNNFNKPNVKLEADMSIYLTEIYKYFDKPNFEIQDGFLTGKFNVSGSIEGIKEVKTFNFSKLVMQTDSKLSDFSYKAESIFIDKLNTKILFDKNNLLLENCELTINESPVRGTLKIMNLIPYLQKNKDLNVVGDLTASNINYNSFKNLSKQNKTDKKSPNINLSLNFLLNNVKYNNLDFKQASGNLIYTNTNLSVENYKIIIFQGIAKGNIKYNKLNEKEYFLSTKTETTDINIQELFKKFNNFNQKSVTYQNIKGKLSSNFEFQSKFIDSKIKNNTINLLGHFLIKDGELNNFKPIMEAAKFSEIPELKHIKFSTLENDLIINKETIYVPDMDIESNAFDMKIKGEQKFLGDYNYHIKLYLSDFTSGKAKRLQKQQSEFGRIEDDGYGRRPLLLIAESKNGNSSVKIDRSAIKNNFKTNIKDKKQELKDALKKEFGLFKNDTTVQKKETKKPKFEIEWDD